MDCIKTSYKIFLNSFKFNKNINSSTTNSILYLFYFRIAECPFCIRVDVIYHYKC